MMTVIIAQLKIAHHYNKILFKKMFIKSNFFFIHINIFIGTVIYNLVVQFKLPVNKHL